MEKHYSSVRQSGQGQGHLVRLCACFCVINMHKMTNNVIQITLTCKQEMVFTARRTYASALLGVEILSVRPSVRLSVVHTRAL